MAKTKKAPHIINIVVGAVTIAVHITALVLYPATALWAVYVFALVGGMGLLLIGLGASALYARHRFGKLIDGVKVSVGEVKDAFQEFTDDTAHDRERERERERERRTQNLQERMAAELAKRRKTEGNSKSSDNDSWL